ncbi:MAG: tetratricopeptide repeat protein [Gemmatimonadota bacterium]
MSPGPSPDEEIRRFEEQVRRNPHSLVFARLADAHRKAGDPDRALEILAAGIERHADYPSAHIVRARAFRDLGRIDEAVASFERVLALDAENLVALRALAEIAEERGDPETARETYARLLALDPSLGGTQARPVREGEPGAVLDAVGDAGSGDAAETFSAEAFGAVLGEPEASEASEAPEGAGAAPGSATAEPEAFEPSPDADMLTRTMAELYASQGLFEEAAEIYAELLKDTPDDAELRDRLEAVRETLAGQAGAEGIGGEEEAAPEGSGPSPVLERWLRRLREPR